jgi:hypothetical protein
MINEYLIELDHRPEQRGSALAGVDLARDHWRGGSRSSPESEDQVGHRGFFIEDVRSDASFCG